MGYDVLTSSLLNYPFKTASSAAPHSPSSPRCSSTLRPGWGELPKSPAHAGRGTSSWEGGAGGNPGGAGRTQRGMGNARARRGARGRVPTRRPAPSWSRGRRSRASAASSPPLPPPTPCRRSWRRPPRTWRAAAGTLSPREERAGAGCVSSGKARPPLPGPRPAGRGRCAALLPPAPPPLPGRRCHSVARRK